mmetsp:Transcript_24106/g.77589  ORF Transcript_24106/g.77589 Transcript_24106/m.77589 type:complete len:218 (-) Transcript_24106:1130-1783(-)
MSERKSPVSACAMSLRKLPVSAFRPSMSLSAVRNKVFCEDKAACRLPRAWPTACATVSLMEACTRRTCAWIFASSPWPTACATVSLMEACTRRNCAWIFASSPCITADETSKRCADSTSSDWPPESACAALAFKLETSPKRESSRRCTRCSSAEASHSEWRRASLSSMSSLLIVSKLYWVDSMPALLETISVEWESNALSTACSMALKRSSNETTFC